MATLKDVLVPDIGDFTDVPIVEVLVAVGDEVQEESPLVEIESDKATMEVPSPFGGVVREVLVSVGDKVAEGVPLVRIEVEGAGEDAPVETGRPVAEAGSASSIQSAISAEAQTADEGIADPPPPASAGGTDDAVPDASAAPRSGSPGEPGEPGSPGEPPYASPVARRMATVLGVDLSSVAGSGRNGRITKDDVSRAANAAPAPSTAIPAPQGGAQVAVDAERVPLTRIQQLSAANLERAWQTIPHVTHHEDADITELEAFRKQLNAEQSDVKVTMVALLLKACASTLDAFPRFASSLDGDEVVVKPERHLGFAADTPNGLMVPVVRDVDRKGVLELAGELTELSGKARAGTLHPREMSGAVFTISSLGGIGGTGFTPIVNPPQVAILGVVRSATRPVWDGTQFVPRLVLPLSLSYDHRVIDGAAAARFCAHLARVLGDLRRALL